MFVDLATGIDTQDIDRFGFAIHGEQDAPAANPGFANSGPVSERRRQARIEGVISQLHKASPNPYSACFWDRVRVMRGLGARSATFCHYNRRRVRIGSAPREASGPDGPSEHAGGASQRSASAGPTLLRIWEY